MDSNDFFKEIDNELTKLSQSDQAKERHNQEQAARVGEFVREVVPRLAEYKEQLEARGVRVTFEYGETSLSFLMYYANGGHHGFRLTRDDKRFKLQGLLTDERGAYTAEGGGVWAVEQSWSWPKLKIYLEDEIRKFFAYASRYGGYQQR